MSDKRQSRGITPISEEDTQRSSTMRHSSNSKKDTASRPKSQTYSDRSGLGGTSSIHSYSEIYQSATRESIDETHVERARAKKNKSKQSITWTHKYTSEMIDKSKNKMGWDELVNLEQLYSLKMINAVEYKMRKRKLIDSMTGTKVNIETENKMNKLLDEFQNPPQKRVLGETEIIKKIVNFNGVQRERAIRHSCHIKFIYNKERKTMETKETWSQNMRIIKMAPNPFSNGTLRYVYYMQDITNKIDINLGNKSNKSPTSSIGIKNTATHVAKIAIDPMEEYEAYFHDVAMQKHAQRFADKFNKNEVPKKVGFLDCWVYELVDRTPHIFCGVEQFIDGEYHKYTNNWDWVNQTIERNTPSAFSHFTYQASKHRILICDLQGVGDLYTDPQMHTYDGKGCGKGNMGKIGIEKFLSSHKCNAICQYLKLPHTNLAYQFTGTLPQKRYMNNEHIDNVPVTNGQYTVPDTKNSTYYGATTTKSQLLPNEVQSDDDGIDDDDYNPFGKRIPDHQDTKNKCWCQIL